MRYSSLYTSRLPTELYPRTYTASDREKGKKIEFSLLFLLFFSSPLSRILQSGMQSTYCFSFGFAFGPFPCQLLGFLPPSDSCPGATFYPNEIGCTSIYNWPCTVSSSFPFFGWGCLSRALWSQHGRSLSWRVIQQPATSCEKKKKENREVP